MSGTIVDLTRDYPFPFAGNADALFFAERTVQRAIARAGRWFWLPCPLCGLYFGGHEWKFSGEHHTSIPTGPGSGKGICPWCSEAGRGDAAWHDSGFDSIPRTM